MKRIVLASKSGHSLRALVAPTVGVAMFLSLSGQSNSAARTSLAAPESASMNCMGEGESFSAPGEAHLMDFTSPLWAPTYFYAGAEGETAVATVSVRPGDCVPGGVSGRGTYVTENGSALASTDYTPASGQTPLLCNDLDSNPEYCPVDRPRWERVSLALHNDSVTEAALESFRFKITSGTVGVDVPSSSPVYTIDTDGAQRFSLEPNVTGSGPVAYERGEFSSGSGISLPVFRAGPANGTATVSLTTAGDGVHPTTQGQDYEVPPNVTFADDQRLAWVAISINNDTIDEENETLRLSLTNPGEGELVSSTTVTLLDNDTEGPPTEEGAPLGRLHHPREGLLYPQNYPYVREIHIFTQAYEDGFPVFRAELALRKRLKNGSCRWWSGSAFVAASCGEVKWFGGLKKPSEDYFRYRMKEKLPLSVGRNSKVRDYMMWARWWDQAGRESKLQVGRNLSRFEIIKPCKNPYNIRKCKPKRPT